MFCRCTMWKMKKAPHNIYIHVPYCMSKCNYCAFFSTACVAPDWGSYVNEICSEIESWAKNLGKIDVPTVFFGGGTPSLMPIGCFEQILGTIQDKFNLLSDAEITIESNPGTLDAEKLRAFCVAGVNRLSVGVQSLSDEKLKFLGRQHNVADALKLLDDARNIGLRVSADFIYGLPGDTVADVINLCNRINTLGLTHCSMYELTIEPNTPFGKMNLQMPDNETMAQMYLAIGDTLQLPRYEVSNYATPGAECRHNQNVWDGQPYLGIGRGAAGRILMDGVWYEQLGNNAQFEKMDDNARAIEMILTGMRTLRGCRLTDTIKNVIDMDWVRKNQSLVQINGDRISATPQGMLILDDLMVKLVK